MKKNLLFLTIMAAAVMMVSCDGKMPEPVQLTVNPNPLTVVGDKVNAEIAGTFPEKKFPKKGVLVVTPVLKFEGQEVLAEPVTYIGEKIKDNGVLVKKATGGRYKQQASFDYVPAMAKSELYLRFDATVGKKKYEIPDILIAKGVVSTAKLAEAKDNKTVITADKFQRIIQETQEAEIRFLIQQVALRNSETGSEQMKDLRATIKDVNAADKKEINKLEVSGYASPDGGLDLNQRLAEQRQANAQRFLQQQLRKDKVNANIASDVTFEDWEGFRRALENSNIQDKDLVLRVLDRFSDPEEREAQIKNISAAYKEIAEEILPMLRRSRLILTYDIIGKSDDEIRELAKNDPAQLNVEELLYAATLTNDNAEKLAIYRKVAELYGDYRAYNNQGIIYFEQGNIAEARRCYAKALELAPANADINYNAGVAALADGLLQKAEQYLGKAAGTTGNLSAAMGTLYTMKGDYAAAQKAYGKSNTNNAAVQQILNEDYAAARKTLNAVAEPNATTAYLLAVVAARTNDRDAVYSNLRTAIERDNALKAKAAKDIEFEKYAEDDQFVAIVK